ncbi:MAG: response regulator transcription factor, partial [Oscillospiraceae bacterium]
MKLLIIEDEVDLAKALQRGFKKSGFASDFAVDGAEGYELYLINEYDLIILDLNLPTMDGIEILEKIRSADKLQRVIILSARSAIEDRIAGLDLGANDYLAKPFDFGELNARVRSLLRRSFIQEGTVVCCGDLCIHTDRKAVTIGAKKIETTAKEYGLLEYLILHAGETISAEELIEHVW